MDDGKDLCNTTVNSIAENCQRHILQNYRQLEKASNTAILNKSLFRGGGEAQEPPVSQGLPILNISRSHAMTHHSWQNSSGRVIGQSQRPLTTHNTHNRQTSMPPVGFEPTISVGERPQTYAIDRAATVADKYISLDVFIFSDKATFETLCILMSEGNAD
jgi:hypothetical protein